MHAPFNGGCEQGETRMARAISLRTLFLAFSALAAFAAFLFGFGFVVSLFSECPIFIKLLTFI